MPTRSQIDQQRLNKVKEDIDLLNIRFPVATIAKRTGIDKGNVSRMLRGKTPCSDTFFNRFYDAFQIDLDSAHPISSKYCIFTVMAKKTKKKGRLTPMEKLTQGYEKFIEGKELDSNGKDKFERAIKKATKPRSAK